MQKSLPNAALSSNNFSKQTVPVADLRISAPPISERPRLVAFVDFGHSGIQTGNLTKLGCFMLKLYFHPPASEASRGVY